MEDKNKSTTSEEETSSEKLSRRNFIGTGAAGLGAMAFAGSVSGQPSGADARKTKRANPDGKFAGKVVLITGATSGIGRATAEAFAREGAKVAFCGRREDVGKQVEDAIKAAGGEATYIRADVRREQDVKNFVEASVKKYNQLDIAFNNAGIFTNTNRVHEESQAAFDDVMNTNLYGVRYAMRYEIPQMLKQSTGGAIINTASTLGLAAITGSTSYIVSKHGVVALTKAAALDYAEQNIRVNAVAPGPIWTPMMERWVNAHNDGKTDYRKIIGDSSPLKRMGRPEEIAQTVLWLSAPEASNVNGLIHTVDGGKMAREG